jgi:hypothetical protein
LFEHRLAIFDDRRAICDDDRQAICDDDDRQAIFGDDDRQAIFGDDDRQAIFGDDRQAICVSLLIFSFLQGCKKIDVFTRKLCKKIFFEHH